MSSTYSTNPTDANAAAPVSELPVYYPWFDWLRAVLAIVVMIGHDGLIPWKGSGNFAVQVFFALSGWLIGSILVDTERRNLPHFYFNRAVRIWVPYYLALALLVAASLLRDPVDAKWIEFIVYKLTFVYNWFGTPQLATHVQQMPLAGTGNHFWSVNAEEQFYLMAPLLLVLTVPRIGRSVVAWLVIAVAAWWMHASASIVFGVTAAVVARFHPHFFSLPAVRAVALVVGLAAAAGIAMDGDYWLLAPPVAICIVLLLARKGQRQRLGAIAGGMSYPLYLNHWIGVYVANAALKPFGLRESAIRHVVSTLVNFAIAIGLYWCVDRRLLARRHAYYTPARGRLATAMAYGTIVVGSGFGLFKLYGGGL